MAGERKGIKKKEAKKKINKESFFFSV